MALVLLPAADAAATEAAAFDVRRCRRWEYIYSSITVRYRIAISADQLPPIGGNARSGNPERREVTRSRRRPPLLKMQDPMRRDSG